VGRFAAWAAAYALVFNVMLTSTLLASITPLKFNALHELCLNGDSASPGIEGNGDDSQPIIRCPLCVSGIAAAVLPSPSPALAIRIELHALLEPVRHDQGIQRLAPSSHQPRGPPHLN
jgi:hypothetical protein